MKGLEYKSVKRLLRWSPVAIVVVGVLVMSVGVATKGEASEADSDLQLPPAAAVMAGDSAGTADDDIAAERLLAPDSSDFYNHHCGTVPDHGPRLRLRRLPPLDKLFNDSNYVQLAAAQALGIDPVATLRDAWNLKRPLVKVTSCRDFFVDTLTHSYPFLVPEAAQLLHDIGRTFRDSLTARGGGNYRIKVTSLLRTFSSVARLRRRNHNAVDTSAHLYGTTFDISYIRFICDSRKMTRSSADMKILLAEVLADLREQGRCYVKYERHQACFHITARPSDDNLPKTQ